ncbi:hypothetical protein CC85DRAFT_278660 [Cutaneotrichosporon oleaginosum]|uniref:Kinetochore protein NDC80 n=1 Tax=Cutaneotrichosporon oleaginosum TaxID=879819 RepID=A0A0J0XFK1_9TREE|nr:uncharacterized protein CC85DRAFT_278660 [Cutaneotrichosporon oleaginosum]KLT39875.1 hypothetical protein CC85DRAFT_278660 [Cutaneotrichosporon oleaginosum]TXT14195.1 hypothetical protein COLE_00388 [Cutaneotrichosporon oleaginosum]
MQPHRRTLAPSGPAGNSAMVPAAPAAAPPPTSMRKAPQRSSGLPRASMASHPYASQSRLSTAAGEGLLQKRRSMMAPSRPADSLLSSSATRADVALNGKTPQSGRALNPIRRASALGPTVGRQSTLAPSYGSFPFKDPRPVKTPAFTAQCKEKIAGYLARSRAQLPLSANWQSSPTTREFKDLFRYLATELIGPSFPWGKSFEKDCLSILRDLHYPVLDTISKTAVTVPGSQQSWPYILAMLDWMVELCKAQQRWHDPESVSDPLLCHASELSLQHPQLEERLFWDFVSETYAEWFEGEVEEFETAQRQLEEAYGESLLAATVDGSDRIAASSVEECSRLERDIGERESELQKLQSDDSPIKAIDEEYDRFMSDKLKFDNFIEKHREKVDNLNHRIEGVRGAIEDIVKRTTTTRQHLMDVEAEVAAQNLSPDEISRMQHDKVALTQQLHDIGTKIAEVKRQCHDQEMRVTNCMDECDQHLDSYDLLGSRIGTLGVIADPLPPGLVRIDYSLSIDLGADDVQAILRSGRAKLETIRPALDSYAQGSRDQIDKLCEEETTLERKHQDVAESVDNRREEVLRRQIRYDKERKQVDEQRELLKEEKSEHGMALANLEAEVRGNGLPHGGVVQAKARLERSRMVFESLLQKTQQLQVRALTELLGHVEAVSSCKGRTEESLESVMRFAERQD